MADRGVGRTPYPATVRLVAVAAYRWSSIEAAYYQIDNLLALPFRRFLNLTHQWSMEMAKDTEEWEMMLESPLPGEAKAKPTPKTAEIEGEAFMAAMQLTSTLKG